MDFPTDTSIELVASTSNGLFNSVDSDPVYIDVNSSIPFDPQRSVWYGTIKDGPLRGQRAIFRFKNDLGIYSTNNWVIPGVYGFWDTTLELVGCGCPEEGQTQSMVVVADGVTYEPDSVTKP